MGGRPYIRQGKVLYPAAWRTQPKWEGGPWRWWFAWRPVRVDGRLVWLQWIARRRTTRTYPDYDRFGPIYPWHMEYSVHALPIVEGHMNDPSRQRPGEWDRSRDKGLLFWYWLPVAAAGVVFAFTALSGLGVF